MTRRHVICEPWVDKLKRKKYTSSEEKKLMLMALKELELVGYKVKVKEQVGKALEFGRLGSGWRRVGEKRMPPQQIHIYQAPNGIIYMKTNETLISKDGTYRMRDALASFWTAEKAGEVLRKWLDGDILTLRPWE